MPYSTNADLPETVRAAYRGHCQSVFRSAFNSALTQYNDEQKAFAVAHAAAQKCGGHPLFHRFKRGK